MSSELNHDETTAAMLLMYLVEELSPNDRQDIERKLEADPTLRAQLAEMREAHEAYLGAMRVVDLGGGHTISDEAAAARARRLVRQWNGSRGTRPQALMKKKEMRVPWWSYPLVAAAAVLVAVVFWGLKNHEADISRPGQEIATGGDQVQQPDQPTTMPLTDTSVSAALSELTPDQEENLLNAFSRSPSGQAGGDDPTDQALASVSADAGNETLGGSDDLDNLLSGQESMPSDPKETR